MKNSSIPASSTTGICDPGILYSAHTTWLKLQTRWRTKDDISYAQPLFFFGFCSLFASYHTCTIATDEIHPCPMTSSELSSFHSVWSVFVQQCSGAYTSPTRPDMTQHIMDLVFNIVGLVPLLLCDHLPHLVPPSTWLTCHAHQASTSLHDQIIQYSKYEVFKFPVSLLTLYFSSRSGTIK